MVTTLNTPRPRRSRVRKTTWPFGVGLAIIAVVVFVAILGPLITPHDPTAIDVRHALLPPLTTSPDLYILGTDNLGRDILSRLILGSRISLLVGLLGVV